MGKVFEGQLSGKGLKIGVVVSRFNDFLTTKLLEGALDALGRNGVLEKDIDVAWVPGSFEIPFAAHRLQEAQLETGACPLLPDSCDGGVCEGRGAKLGTGGAEPSMSSPRSDLSVHELAFGALSARPATP